MPLRSATEFPITPDPEALEGTYQDCRAALVSANRSRGVLKAPGLIESLSQVPSAGLRPLGLVGGNGSLLCQKPLLSMALPT